MVSLTRRGALNVRPASRLTARNRSVVPSGSAPPQTTATNRPSAATEGVAFVRPGAPSVVGVAAWPGIVKSNRHKATDHMGGDHANDRITPPKRLEPGSPGGRERVRLCGLASSAIKRRRTGLGARRWRFGDVRAEDGGRRDLRKGRTGLENVYRRRRLQKGCEAA